MAIPVPQIENFSITPMLSAYAQGQATKVALEDRQRAYDAQIEERIVRGAQAADTPEKWANFVGVLQDHFPDADLSEFSDFSAREYALSQQFDPYQRAQLDISQRQLALQEQAAARSAQPSAPTPYTNIGRIGMDQQNGFLTPEQAARLTAAELGLGGDNPPDFGSEDDLRSEFSGLVGDFNDVEASYRRVQAATETPSAAGDLALIFNYMKMLDPGSTVREGEFANAQNAGGIDDWIVSQYNSVVNGERLSADQRADFLNRAGQMYGAQLQQYNSIAGAFQNLAVQQGLDPNRVVLQRDLPPAPGGVTPIAPYQPPQPAMQQQPAQAAVAPAVGEVRDGYRFLGGDPADPNSWQRVAP